MLKNINIKWFAVSVVVCALLIFAIFAIPFFSDASSDLYTVDFNEYQRLVALGNPDANLQIYAPSRPPVTQEEFETLVKTWETGVLDYEEMVKIIGKAKCSDPRTSMNYDLWELWDGSLLTTVSPVSHGHSNFIIYWQSSSDPMIPYSCSVDEFYSYYFGTTTTTESLPTETE